MAQRGSESEESIINPEKGKVQKVSRQWSEFEDEVLAYRLQEGEFKDKYQWNRQDRQVGRQDAPLAKHVQTAEEERLQRERFQQLERQRKLSEEDARIARQVQLDEERTKKEMLGRTVEDVILAQQYQTEEMLSAEQTRIRTELQDQEYARLLQEKERRRYERRQQERALAKQRKAIEREQAAQADEVLTGYKPESERYSNEGHTSPQPEDAFPIAGLNQAMSRMGVTDNKGVLRPDGRVEDLGDFSDFYIPPSTDMDPKEKRELQELQDEELARLLQDQEKKRGAVINRDKLKAIEDRDAELARIMYQQEKLKAKKRSHHRQPPPDVAQNGAGNGHMPAGPTRSGDAHAIYNNENQFNESMNQLPPQMSPGSAHSNQSEPMWAISRDDDDLSGQRMRPADYSHYQSRPLPERPDDNSAVVRVNDPGSPSSPPPGYRPPPAYKKKENSPHTPRSDNDSPPLPQGNVIAAIDPTFHRHSLERAQMQRHSPVPDMHVNNSPPVRHPQPAEETPKGEAPMPKAEAKKDTAKPPEHIESVSPPPQPESPTHRGGDDSYVDLDDIGPVQGQKRTTLTRGAPQKGSKKNEKGGKKENCKQQ